MPGYEQDEPCCEQDEPVAHIDKLVDRVTKFCHLPKVYAVWFVTKAAWPFFNVTFQFATLSDLM